MKKIVVRRIADYLNEVARTSGMFYNLTPEEVQKLRGTFLDMYNDVKKVCNKYGLDVMLGGGSCLGAVRHQGFIPWDDDFDMLMSREHYDRFIDVFDKELSDKYLLSAPKNKDGSKTLFMQLVKKGTTFIGAEDLAREDANGIRVDIYPIDRAPDGKIARYIKFKFLDLLRVLVISTTIYEGNKKNKLFKQAFCYSIESRIYYYIRYTIGAFFSLFGRKRLYNFFDYMASSSTGNKYRTIPTGRGFCRKECHPSDVFFPPKPAKFEGLDVLIPNNADSYLSAIYGDYMKVPPVEKRERHFYVKVDFGEE